MNLKTTVIRRVLAIIAAVCLLSVSGGISGADFDSPQSRPSIATAEVVQGLSGVTLTSRISSRLLSNPSLHAKHPGEFQPLAQHLALSNNTEFLLVGICKKLPSALAFPQVGRSPPFLTI